MRTLPHWSCAMVVALATLASAQNVLIHDDSYSTSAPQPSPAEQACIDLTLPYMTTPDFATFDAQLTGGATWDLVIVQHVNFGGVPTTLQMDNLNTYLTGGGRLIFGSWQAAAQAAHPLFATMECLPVAGTGSMDQFVWDGGTFITCGVTSPQTLTDPVGFGIDTITADAIPPGRALMGQVTPTPTPGNGTVILGSSGRSLFVGFMPLMMDPQPTVGNAFMNAAVQEILNGPLPIADIFSNGMTITPTPTIDPAGAFDVDVDVSSTAMAPLMVTVDLFYGVGEPPPLLPASGLQSQQVMVPAGGSIQASFPGIPAGGVAEVWRVHAAVNADLMTPECDTSNNIVSDIACIADSGCAANCGNCDEIGGLPVTILDALVGAQIAAGLVMPNMNQTCVCDVNASGTIDVLDALVMAQAAAGLLVMPTCGSAGGGFAVSMLPTPPPGRDPVRMPFDLCGGSPVDMVAEFSTDSGTTWTQAAARAGSPLPSPSPGTLPALDLGFWWDSQADVPIVSRPVMADLRLVFTEPMSGATEQLGVSVQLLPGPAMISYIDPVASGHAQNFTPGTDDSSADIMLPFAFPYWDGPVSTTTTTTVGFGTNGGLRMGGGYTGCCGQPPLWTYTAGAPTIHAHGADGYTGSMYSFTDPTMAVFSYESMDYCCVGPGAWSTQVVLLPNGDFQIRQVQATTDVGRLITIGFSDGLATDNSVPGATGIDWDAFPVASPTPIGQTDFGSSEPGGMATGVVLYFVYDPVTGYTAWRLQ